LLGYTIERELGKLPCLKIREERKMKELMGIGRWDGIRETVFAISRMEPMRNRMGSDPAN